ncbi:serine carboxypeptidase [Stereum hirsutum FP-91666 SS1]|uniref:serine carboxypeptidase n=1 Tax=Stereum hirsutum (strain FP-91666) TaxID=721885 RepID=UPI0004449C47|nr:serine carboxypeptidase [Stereum hirsutum FP-91666 SS1]EIM83897.1 serine carboxypeptidase [Stereum hirsutum FP-91666 SS1]
MGALSETFTVLRHPAFPQYSTRIRKTDFCDTTSQAYSGYVDIEVRHIFFYYFESRNDPSTDDVIMWINGGPGASASIGLMMELGPCSIVNDTHVEFNPYSWNANANVLFVDQPVGVGFSYAEYGETVSSTPEAAKDMAAFIAILFNSFSSLKGRPFHVAGESYGGRYTPVFAAEIYDQNAKLVEIGMEPINLTSVMIGNGVTDPYSMTLSYNDFSCSAVSAPLTPFLPISTCVRMEKAVQRCQRLLKDSCIDQYDQINCQAAHQFCDTELTVPMFSSGLSVYDIRTVCEGEVTETICYYISLSVGKYLSQTSIRESLGVDDAVPQNFSTVGWAVNRAFEASGDEFQSSHDYIAALLDRGVRVLVYVGNYDAIANWVGNERWTLDMDWTGKIEYGSQTLREWIVGGRAAGLTRSAKGLTFATVFESGHMVPHDKPQESLAMVNRWLRNVAL